MIKPVCADAVMKPNPRKRKATSQIDRKNVCFLTAKPHEIGIISKIEICRRTAISKPMHSIVQLLVITSSFITEVKWIVNFGTSSVRPRAHHGVPPFEASFPVATGTELTEGEVAHHGTGP